MHATPATTDPAILSDRYRKIRGRTEQLAEPLDVEDYALQSMPDCSPPKWHLAHTTWFFETFILTPHEPDFRPHHPLYRYLFNSYYEAVGDRWPRPARGLLSRPTVAQVFAYRRAIDDRMHRLIERSPEPIRMAIASLVELGLNHEQQHQELMLTDLKHAFGINPLQPIYLADVGAAAARSTPIQWEEHAAGVRWIGHAEGGFSFDNESPRHRVFVDPFRIASRPVTAGEFLAFMRDGGYERPSLWLSDGWAARQERGWTAPHYWEQTLDGWSVFTLHGQRPLEPSEPVCHISYYEADAFAQWSGARLPTEAEWEVATSAHESSSLQFDPDRFHPRPDAGSGQWFGDVWQWTASPYTSYPGYRPAAGAVGEYNGKFMCNQFVLRGGSCATPWGHSRPTYRNFFPPDARWQFSGLRLAEDLPA